MAAKNEKSRFASVGYSWRLKTAVVLWGIGFIPPLLIPAVSASELALPVKALLSASLVVGVPQFFTVVAIALVGPLCFRQLVQRCRSYAASAANHIVAGARHTGGSA